MKILAIVDINVDWFATFIDRRRVIEAHISKGFSNETNAVLLIDGESSVMKLTGEVVLVNEKGSWRVDDELTDVVLQ